jgi:hypothetical protein
MVVKQWRIFYAPDKDAWRAVLGVFRNSDEGIKKLIARFNRRDVGNVLWSYEECLPDEYGYDHGD